MSAHKLCFSGYSEWHAGTCMQSVQSSSGGRTAALLLCALSLLAASIPASAAGYLDALRSLSQRAHVTALVVRLDDMTPIASLNPDQRLTPASVSKLFAAAGALKQFGPAHRFKTTLTTDGSVSNGTLNGNLILVGGGDPSLDDARLWRLLNRLRGAGVDHVTGDLIVNDGLFGSVPCLTKDRCNAKKSAWHAYSAPLSAAGVNFGTVHASVYAGELADDPTRVVLHPWALPGYRLDNRVDTGLPNTRPHMKAWRTFEGGTSTLHLRGSLPAGSGPYEVSRAVTDPAAETARVFSALLAGAGIHLDGTIRTRDTTDSSGHKTLAQTESDTLAEQLIPMMAYSNNYMADTLTLDLAADSHYNRPLNLSLASQSLEALAEQANHESFPAHTDSSGPGPIFDTGSGLAVSNKLSARDLVSLLGYMYRQEQLFPAFYGSLPTPLSAPSRTLKQGNFDWLTRMVAKTGTLSEPVTVRALAGYFRLADGGFGAFGFIINGTSSNPALTYRQTVTAYQTDMEAILADY